MRRGNTESMRGLPLNPRSFLCALLVGPLGWGVSASCLAQAGALFAIPTELKSSQALPPDSPWHIVLHSSDAVALAKILSVSPPRADATTLDYTVNGYREISGAWGRSWLEESFVIDFRERAVADLYAAFTKSIEGRPWTRQALVAFVASAMSVSLGSPFEIASQVARSRSGDCKEYAVLTAALARSAGVPARVALGVVIHERNGHYAAYGHAWAETREAGHWVVADAALEEDRGVKRYLPFGVLDDEGPGFQMSLSRLVPTSLETVTIIGTP